MKSDEFTEEEIAKARAELKATVPPMPSEPPEAAYRELAGFFKRALRAEVAHAEETTTDDWVHRGR